MRLPVHALLELVNIGESPIRLLCHICAVASKFREVLCHIGQCVEMSGKERSALVHVMEVMQACKSDSDAVFWRCAATDLIHDDLRKLGLLPLELSSIVD